MEHKKVECEKYHNFFTIQNIIRHVQSCTGTYIKYIPSGLPRQYKVCEKCGTEISVQNYQKHFNSCKGIKKEKYISRDKNKEGKYYCKYCNSLPFNNRKELKEYLLVCKIYQGLPKDSLGRVNSIKSMDLTDKRSCTCEFCGRVLKKPYGLTFHKKHCHKNPDYVVSLTKHPCSDENRVHQALLVNQRLKEFGQVISFNKEACEFINKLNAEKNWNLQHAMNGGEYQVGPYYLDGYDKDKNIAFEYNEPAHYESPERILRDRKRAEFIHQKLNCQFFVYNEKEDNLEQWY